MASKIGELFFDIVAKDESFRTALEDALSKAKKADSGINAHLKSISAGFATAGKKMSLFVTAPVLALGAAALSSAAKMEQQQVAFETMLGSASDAKNILKEFQDLAAKTPFQQDEIIQTGKALISFGESAENVSGTITRLGDVAAGLSIPLKDLGEIYGKARVQQTLYAEDLNQLAGRGIPIFTELAKVTGQNASEIKKMASEGKIGFSDLETVFKNLTKEGGQFAGLMDKQSKTLAGSISTLKDNFAIASRELVEAFVPVINESVIAITGLIQQFNNADESTKSLVLGIAGIAAATGPVLIITSKLISAYGSLVAVKTAYVAIQKGEIVTGKAAVVAMIGQKIATIAMAVATDVASAAMVIFNAVMMANPFILAAVAIIAVGAAIYAFTSSSEDATEAVKKQVVVQYNMRTELEKSEEITNKAIAANEQRGVSLQKVTAYLNVRIARERAVIAVSEQAIATGQKYTRMMDLQQHSRSRSTKNLKVYQAQLDKVQAQEKKSAEIEERKEASQRRRAEMYSKYSKIVRDTGKTESQLLIEEKNREIVAVNAIYKKGSIQGGVIRLGINQKYNALILKANQDAAAASTQKSIQSFNKYVGAFQGVVGQLSAISQAYSQNQLDRLEKERERRLEILDEQRERELESKGIKDEEGASEAENEQADLEYQLAAAQSAEDKADLKAKLKKVKNTVALEKIDQKYADKKEAIEEELDKKKKKIEYEAAKRKKATDIISSIMNTALGVTMAYSAFPGPVGIAFGATVGSLGAVQTALIAAQPLPEYASGGLAVGPSIFGEAGRELAIPLTGQQGQSAIAELSDGLLDQIGRRTEEDSFASVGGEGVTQIIELNIDGESIETIVQKGLDNRRIFV